jgi:hypothetical protein
MLVVSDSFNGISLPHTDTGVCHESAIAENVPWVCLKVLEI